MPIFYDYQSTARYRQPSRARKNASATIPRGKKPGYAFDPNNVRHWCFDDCPKEELFLCWHYEYLRHCPSVIERVLTWRAKQNNLSPEHYIEFVYNVPYQRVMLDWPCCPYLEIDPVRLSFTTR